MDYPRQHYQQQSSSGGPGWILFCAILAVVLALIALPWAIVGFVLRSLLSRWLHWKLSLLLWVLVFFIALMVIYNNLQHGLQPLMIRELDDYILAAKQYQTNFLHWPFKRLWSDTFPVWLRTWQSIGIAGCLAEVYTKTRTDTVKTLRKQEQQRERRAQRSQRRARKRTSRPAYIPDAIDNNMIVGIAIHDDNTVED